MSSDAPRSVRLSRLIVSALALVPLSSALLWIYGHEIKPYQVRYFAHEIRNSPAKFQVELYSDVDASDSVLVSLDCHPDNLVDVTFRPVLQESRDWSLREMLPSISEVNTFLARRNARLVDEIADRHLPGGLSEWEGLERIQLRNRLGLTLARFKRELTGLERKSLEQQLISRVNPHETALLVVPPRISGREQLALRDAIDHTQQSWEKRVAAINSNWLLRWQLLTGTILAVPSRGLGAATPLYVLMPPPKQGTGAVLGIERESPVLPQGVQVMVGDQVAYQVPSLEQLKSSSIVLLLRDEWWLVPLLVAASAILALVYYSYWRWPKHLKTPALFREAETRNTDELWGELRRRNAWVDSYILSCFFAARAGVLPNADVISYFWTLIRETLRAHPVPADTEPEVRHALLEILDRSIQNALS